MKNGQPNAYHDDAGKHREREIPPVFMRWTTGTNIEYVRRLISEAKLDVKPLTTHPLLLDDIDDAVTPHIESPDSTLRTVMRIATEME